MALSAPTGYRSLLREEFDRRCRRNARFSLRAFARQIGLAPSRVSELLRGKQGLSLESGRRVASRLGWSARKCDRFCDLVELEHSRSPVRRKLAQARLETHTKGESGQLAEDAFRAISDWHHFALLELFELPDAPACADQGIAWFARKLGLHPKLARETADRLTRVGLLARDQQARLRPTSDYSRVSSGVPSEAIRRFHAQVLQKALRSVQGQPIQARDLSSIFLPFDSGQIEEARAVIQKFRRGFSAELASDRPRDSLYCLAIQFFRVDEIGDQAGKGGVV